jgi:phosphosulfolactate synthase
VIDEQLPFGRFLGVEYAARGQQKPRTAGLTMVMDQGWPNEFTRGLLQDFGEYLDVVKLWDPVMRAPTRQVKEKVQIYRDHGVIVQPGGLIIELARQQGKLDSVLDSLAKCGFDAIEISSTTSTRMDFDSDADAVQRAKQSGMRIFGEVGRKFADGDETRLTEDVIDVERTVAEFDALLSAGAEYVYWEGHLLRKVMGDDPEAIRAHAGTGTAQVREVANRVGVDKIMFEVSGLRPRQNRQWLQFWLIRIFGPEVNIANARIEEMPNLEALRAGSHPIFGFGSAGNYPWIRAWGEGRDDWWKG